MLLPVQVAAEVALKLHAIQSADTVNMTPKQYAEFIAEELADITYQVAANKLIQTAKDRGIPQGFVRMTREMLKGDPEVALAGGGSASASAAQPEGPTTQLRSNNNARSGGGSNGAAINQSSTAILKDGYYEANGFKFTEYYYKRLWDTGRKAPSLTAQSILDYATEVIPDPRGYEGFYKYVADDWYMIYNPITKIVSHLEKLG